MRNIFFWNIYNQHSIGIQTKSTDINIGRITAARIAINTSILGAGELIMGYFSEYLSLNHEILIRLVIGVFIAKYAISKSE